MTMLDWIRAARESGAVIRPESGLRVVLALRACPRSDGVQDMVDRIDEIDGYPFALERKRYGGAA